MSREEKSLPSESNKSLTTKVARQISTETLKIHRRNTNNSINPRQHQPTKTITMSTTSSQQSIAKLALALALFILLCTTIECHYAKRTQYHEQGVHGPKSYKFGFTSGDHKNPQERHEVSDGYGHVKGWYSFVDAHGKYQKVHYEAHPKYGFKVLNYNSKAYNTGKRHYNS